MGYVIQTTFLIGVICGCNTAIQEVFMLSTREGKPEVELLQWYVST